MIKRTLKPGIDLSLDITLEEAFIRIEEEYSDLEGPYNGLTKEEYEDKYGSRHRKIIKHKLIQLQKIIKAIDFFEKSESLVK